MHRYQPLLNDLREVEFIDDNISICDEADAKMTIESLFYRICSTNSTIHLLKKYGRAILSTLNIDSLNAPCLATGKLTALFWCSTTYCGIQFIKLVCQLRPYLVTSTGLCTVATHEYYSGRSALYNLCWSHIGLKLLLSYRHILMPKITNACLNSRAKTQSHQNRSALYFLFSNIDASSLCIEYGNILLKSITEDTLNCIIHNDESLAYRLLSSATNIKLVKDHYPQLLLLISPHALNQQVDVCGHIETAIFWLFALPDGRDLVKKWHAHIILNIMPSSLNLLMTRNSYKNHNIVFYLFKFLPELAALYSNLIVWKIHSSALHAELYFEGKKTSAANQLFSSNLTHIKNQYENLFSTVSY